MVTGIPALAKQIAMPPPMVPAPMIAALLKRRAFTSASMPGTLRVAHQLECFLDADQARQALRATGAGDDAERHLGKAEARTGRGDAIVAGERDLESSSHHGAVHGGHHRERQVLDRVEEAPVLFF